jgi:transcriptional regulator with XRE-family HTH domain
MAKTNEYEVMEPATIGSYRTLHNEPKKNGAEMRGEAADLNVPARRGRKRGSTNANRVVDTDRRRKRETEVIVGESIRRLRTDANLSQEELGRASKMSTSYISRLETGEVNPTVDALMRIVRVFGLTIDGLLELDAQPSESNENDDLDPEIRVWLYKLKGKAVSERTKRIIQTIIKEELEALETGKR